MTYFEFIAWLRHEIETQRALLLVDEDETVLL